jgi:hypothetical protein
MRCDATRGFVLTIARVVVVRVVVVRIGVVAVGSTQSSPFQFRKVPELADYLLHAHGFPNHAHDAMQISRQLRQNEKPTTPYTV